MAWPFFAACQPGNSHPEKAHRCVWELLVPCVFLCSRSPAICSRKPSDWRKSFDRNGRRTQTGFQAMSRGRSSAGLPPHRSVAPLGARPFGRAPRSTPNGPAPPSGSKTHNSITILNKAFHQTNILSPVPPLHPLPRQNERKGDKHRLSPFPCGQFARPFCGLRGSHPRGRTRCPQRSCRAGRRNPGQRCGRWVLRPARGRW